MPTLDQIAAEMDGVVNKATQDPEYRLLLLTCLLNDRELKRLLTKSLLTDLCRQVAVDPEMFAQVASEISREQGFFKWLAEDEEILSKMIHFLVDRYWFRIKGLIDKRMAESQREPREHREPARPAPSAARPAMPLQPLRPQLLMYIRDHVGCTRKDILTAFKQKSGVTEELNAMFASGVVSIHNGTYVVK